MTGTIAPTLRLQDTRLRRNRTLLYGVDLCAGKDGVAAAM